MTSPDSDHEVRRSAAEASHEPRQVPRRTGADASNTPIAEIVEPLSADEDREVRQLVRDALADMGRPADDPAAG